jgi:hypothetical protein
MKKISRANLFLTLTLLLFSTATFLFSCSKDNDNNDNYHISFKVDGVLKEFNAFNFAQFDDFSGPNTALTISGVPKLDGSEGSFAIDIFPPTSGTPAAVTAHTYADTDTDYDITVLYFAGAAGPDYQAGTFVKRNADVESVTIANHLSITISELTSKIVRGHFSGDFYLDGDPTQQKVSITEGDFYVEFK